MGPLHFLHMIAWGSKGTGKGHFCGQEMSVAAVDTTGLPWTLLNWRPHSRRCSTARTPAPISGFFLVGSSWCGGVKVIFPQVLEVLRAKIL